MKCFAVISDERTATPAGVLGGLRRITKAKAQIQSDRVAVEQEARRAGPEIAVCGGG